MEMPESGTCDPGEHTLHVIAFVCRSIFNFENLIDFQMFFFFYYYLSSLMLAACAQKMPEAYTYIYFLDDITQNIYDICDLPTLFFM